MSSCSGGDTTLVDVSTTTAETSDLSTAATVAAEDASTEAPALVEPAATGPLTDFELGGLTLGYDADYWEIEPFGPDDPDDALVWFTSASSNAVVQLSFTNKSLDPEDDVCGADYAGNNDPERHVVTLLHQEVLANGGRLRIHEQDLDTSGDEAAVGISYAQLTFGVDADAGENIGDTFCEYSRWIEVSERVREDGSPVYYRVEAFFAFSMDFVFAPFKEQFGSAEEMLQRPGFAETLALIETIEVAGTPTESLPQD